MCAIDVIIIFDYSFWLSKSGGDDGEVEEGHITKSADWFNNSRSSQVHDEVKALVRMWNPLEAFDYERLEKEMCEIVERHHFQPGECPNGSY